MAQSIDTKIVELKFNNDNFADKVDSTLTKLEQLNEQIKEVGVKEAFKNLSKGAKDVDISHISKGVDEVNKGFSKMEVVGMTALVNISNAAVNLGKRLISNLVNPLTKGVMQGGLARAKNIEQATFQFEGQKIGKSKGNETKSYYEEVMQAVLGTSYSYDVAAKAASQLAASNVGVEKSMKKLADGTTIEAKVLNTSMTDALLGIAGVAAMTGSNFDDISQIFTRVAGQGKVMANDLNSIASRGLNAAAVLANSLGKTEEDIREMVRKGQIDFQMFSDAMSKAFGAHAKDSTLMFQGALDDVNAALARIGADFYGPALNAGRDILNSITPVVDAIHNKLNPALSGAENIMEKTSKSLSQYLDMFAYLIEMYPKMDRTQMGDWIKEHMNAWTNIADLYQRGNIKNAVKDLQEYSKTFRDMNGKKGINGYQMLGDYFDVATNTDVLKKYLNKSDKEIEKITDNAKLNFKDLQTVINGMIDDGIIGFNTFFKAFHKLWSESEDLMTLEFINDDFNDYVRTCIRAEEPSEKFNKHLQTFASIINGARSLFSSFSTILGGIADIFLTIAQHLKPLGKLFVDATAELAKFVVKIADLLATSESFNRIIDGVVSLINKIFSLFSVSKLAGIALAGITKAFDFLGLAIEKVYSGVSTVVGTISRLLQAIADKTKAIITNTEELSKIFKALKGAGIIVMISRIALALTRPAEILETIRAAVLNTRTAIESVLASVKYVFFNLGQISKNINAFVYQLTTTLKRMQELIVATAILEIAMAIGVLAAAIYFLSKVNIKGANNTLIATIEVLAIMFSFVEALKIMKKSIVSKVKVWERTSEGVKDIAKAFLIMSVSVLMIAGAIKMLSELKPESMWNAFAVIELLLITLAGIAKLLSTSMTRDTGLKWLIGGKFQGQRLTKGLYGLVAMAMAIKIVAKAITDIAKVTDKEALWNAVGVIELIMWSVAAIVKWLSSDHATKMAKGTMMLLGMALAIKMLTKPILQLTDLAGSNNDAMWSAVAAIGALMAVMSILMKLLSGSKGLIKAGAALVIMAKAIQILADVVVMFSGIDSEAMWNAIAGIAMSLISIVIALALINPKGILKKVAAIYIIAEALETLSGIIMEFGYNNEAAWAGIGVATIALLGLAGACWVFKKVPLGGILKLFLTLSLGAAVVIEFGVAIGIFGIGIGIFGAGLGVLADSAKKAEDVGGTIIGIMTGFAIAIGILTSVGLPAIGVIFALATAFLLFGIGMTKMGSGMTELATAVKIMTEMQGELRSTIDEITVFIDSLKKMTDDAAAIGESFKSISDPLTAIKEAASDISEQIEKLVKAYTELVEKSSNSITQLSDSLTAISKFNKDSFSEATTAVSDFISGLSDMESRASTVSTMATDLSTSLDGLKNAFEFVVEVIGKFKDLSYRTFDSLGESISSIADPIKTLNDLRGEFEGLSTDLDTFVKSLSTMKDNAAIVSEGATAISDSLKEVGDSANMVSDAFSGLTRDIADIMSKIGSGLQDMGAGIKTIVKQKDKLDPAAAAIEDFYAKLEKLNGLSAEIAGGTKAVAGAVETLGKAAKKTAALSKSGMNESGGKMVDGLISGMTGKQTDLTTKVEVMVSKVESALKKRRKQWYDIGVNLIAGMVSGIASQQWALEQEVQKLEDKAERAAKAHAKINSPSKVWMKIGASLGEGLTLGIKNSGDQVRLASINLASTSEDAIQSAIYAITDAMENDFDLNPKITPVVDLSNIRNGAALANSAFTSSLLGVRGNGLAASITHTIQNGGKSAVEKSIDSLTDQIGSMTDTMNSRSLNNYINIDGSTDPEAFADGLIRSFKLNARTV